ncbi:unnamed protein product [Blepharisma stoltei]|uniref:Ribosomal protein S18 n=1 Tax=Blepharisma stoltei TaxID=1481888 RepID=A0AAU9J8M5_9CILI|nr:unnamed protein product [Blepharisma stoltei]
MDPKHFRNLSGLSPVSWKRKNSSITALSQDSSPLKPINLRKNSTDTLFYGTAHAAQFYALSLMPSLTLPLSESPVRKKELDNYSPTSTINEFFKEKRDSPNINFDKKRKNPRYSRGVKSYDFKSSSLKPLYFNSPSPSSNLKRTKMLPLFSDWELKEALKPLRKRNLRNKRMTLVASVKRMDSYKPKDFDLVGF